MSRIRALLIGVDQYTHPRQEVEGQGKKWVNKDMPSAKNDVAAMQALLSERGVAPHDCRVLTGSGDTTRVSILRALEELFGGAGPTHRLVLYFSGHGGRANISTAMNQQPSNHEVLCPSDTDWKSTYISEEDLRQYALAAVQAGAFLEVILETCSFSGVKSSVPLRIFGNAFGGSQFPAGRGVVWCASGKEENSHSGPVPCCSSEPPVGLFTHYFCEGVRRELTRERVLAHAARKLQQYFKDARACCGALGPQKPRLIGAKQARSKLPFTP